MDCDESISKDDVSVTWETLMGNPQGSESDQLAVARVLLSHNGEVFSERKINFAQGAIDIINRHYS